jgi:hypothetical protein
MRSIRIRISYYRKGLRMRTVLLKTDGVRTGNTVGIRHRGRQFRFGDSEPVSFVLFAAKPALFCLHTGAGVDVKRSRGWSGRLR